MTIGASEPNVLLDLTAGALRTVAEAIVGALYVLAELATASSALRKLDVVHLRNSSRPAIGSVRKRKEAGGYDVIHRMTTDNAMGVRRGAGPRGQEVATSA